MRKLIPFHLAAELIVDAQVQVFVVAFHLELVYTVFGLKWPKNFARKVIRH